MGWARVVVRSLAGTNLIGSNGGCGRWKLLEWLVSVILDLEEVKASTRLGEREVDVWKCL